MSLFDPLWFVCGIPFCSRLGTSHTVFSERKLQFALGLEPGFSLFRFCAGATRLSALRHGGCFSELVFNLNVDIIMDSELPDFVEIGAIYDFNS